MPNNPSRQDPIPDNFSSLEEFWQFWDTHSSADYEDLMTTVDVEIDLLSSKAYCAISRDILDRVRTRARQQGVSVETLVNLWLQQKLAESREPRSAYALREEPPEYVAGTERTA